MDISKILNIKENLGKTPKDNFDGKTAFDFSFTKMEGEPLPLAQFKGKLILIVNTASLCGFTSQYRPLEALHQRYKDKGLIIIGVPCNDFGGQEPSSNLEIKEFCELKYKVSFILTDKINIKGQDPHPFYQWAEHELGFLSSPIWNFHKYLIGTNGKILDWFSSVTEPMEPKIIKTIEEHLPKQCV